MMGVCDTCGRRLRGKLGELVSTDRNGNQTAWCATHARNRTPWFGRAGWPWMRELDRLWRKVEKAELEELLKNGGRDLTFDHRPPLAEGDVRHVGSMELRILWVRQSKPGRWTVRVRRFIPERPLMLRTGPLPFTSTKRDIVHAPTASEVERAASDSAYRSNGDPLDAGQAPSAGALRDYARRARLRRAVEIAEEISDAA